MCCTRKSVYSLCLIFAAASGCSHTPELLNLAQDEARLIGVANEWRQSWRIRLAQPGVVHLGAVTGDHVLRIGVRDAGIPEARVTVRILADGRLVEKRETKGLGQWRDWRIEIPENFAAAEFAVELASEQPFYVSDLALVPKQSGIPNVLIYLVDTLRSDHLHCYGYPRRTSPHIDALAADGTRFRNAVPQSSWTRPAVASLLTSTYPAVHGANDRSQKMRQDLDTLGAALQSAGYTTTAFISNPTCTPYWGIGKEFERLVDVDSTTVEPDKDAKVVDAVLDALDLVEGRPWFFYVHAIAPHDPYEAPEPYGSMFLQDNYQGSPQEQLRARTIDAYDGEIAYTDAQFGRLIESLKERGLYDNTLIILVSDHGEEFWEHGVNGHGLNLYEPQLDVPLIVKQLGQRGAGAVRDDLVELIDIAPTILSLLDLPRPSKFQGRAILPQPPPRTTPAYASLDLERASMRMARDERYKYINDIVAEKELWFDLLADPAESRPLEPAQQLEALASHARHLSLTGAPGLHILATGSLEDGRSFHGTVRATDLGPARVQYEAENAEVTQQHGAISFTITLAPAPDAPTGLQEWFELTDRRNYAHLYIPCPPQPFEFDLQFDGQPLAPGMLTTPAPEITALLDGQPIDATAFLGQPQEFEPARLSPGEQLYIWYQPPPYEIDDQELDPDMLQALEALGYIH